MAQGRSSLISDSGFDSIGSKGGKSGKDASVGMDTAAIVKIGIGGVALLAGVYLILNSLGVFQPNPYGATIPEAEAQQIEQQRVEEQKQFLELNKNVTIGGA
jgi:hypothetical protein